jgi:hypothetical protein
MIEKSADAELSQSIFFNKFISVKKMKHICFELIEHLHV